jgi:acyl transferase domain-containing protein
MRDENDSRVNEIIISLPICVGLQISLVRLLQSWGIRPTGVTGHSSGEVGAAYIAGAIDIKSAMAIVYTRGSLTTKFQEVMDRRGGMVAVGLGRDDANSYISRLTTGQVVVACVNSPSSVTISGDLVAIEELEAILGREKIFARKLKVDAGYHSHHMQPIADDYHKLLSRTLKEEPQFGDIIFSSPTTGKRINSAAVISSPEHWVKNMVQPVEFVDSLANLCLGEFHDDEGEKTASVDILVEIGPHGALAGPIRQNLMRPELKDLGISYSTCLRRGESAVDTMHQLVCALVSSGYHVDLGAVNFPNRNSPQVLTDLPPYPWNHQVKHWHESRTNKTLRERGLPPHDLLGSPSLDSNSLAPTWRHIIRPSNIPWLRDHQIQSTIIYPGAGYLSMAIEGIRQVTPDAEKEVAGYELSNIDISRALVVPETSKGVEVQLSFQRCSDKILGSQSWQEFHIYSVDEAGGWNQHCEGLIRTVYESSDSARPKTIIGKRQDHLGALPKSMLPEDIYKSLRAVGINHGPIFQNIKSIRAGKGQSLCSFAVANTSATMPNEHEEKHLIHPTTLDSIFQAVYSALPGRQVNGMIPKTIKSILVSGNISSKAGHMFEAYSRLSKLSSQGFDTSIKVVDSLAPMTSPVLEVVGMHCQSLGSTMGSSSNPDDSKLCFSSVWKPDFATIKRSDFSDMFLPGLTSLDVQVIDEICRAAALYIHEAIIMLGFAELEALSTHQKSFYFWMKTQDANIDPNLLLLSEEKKEYLLRTVESSSADGHIVCKVGQNLSALLQGTISSKELIAEGVGRNYFEGSLRVEHSYTQITQIIEVFSHKTPRSRILEVGGGSGATTQVVLRALSSQEAKSNPRFGHYDFTDRFPNSMESARADFKDFANLMSFGVLDIEESPASQNFRSKSYDLVILSQGVLGVNDLHTAMSNVHDLLKPGGTVLILAHNLERLDVRLVFGGLSASIYSK